MNESIIEDRKIHKQPKGFTLYKDDVWGAYDVDNHKRLSNGMIVARSEDKCYIFKDVVPYKSVTIVFDAKEYNEEEVEYWLEYVQGGDSISNRKEANGKVALRSDYHCW